MVDKVIRDGLVAVLYSPNYGAGWSTWVHGDTAEASLFDPEIVAWIEAEKPDDTKLEEFDKKYGYTGGLRDIKIEWLPVGTRFSIDEYDGWESIHILTPDYGYTA